MNYNRCIFGGRLTRDPELRTVGSGTAVCKFGLAINEHYTSGGVQKKRTTYIDCVAWARMGETISKYMSKGSEILVEGRMELSTWEDQSGAKRSKLECIVDRFQFVGGQKEEETP